MPVEVKLALLFKPVSISMVHLIFIQRNRVLLSSTKKHRLTITL